MSDNPYKYFGGKLCALSQLAKNGDKGTGSLFTQLISEVHDSSLCADEKSLLKAVIVATVGTLGLLGGMKKGHVFVDFSNISDEFKRHIQLGKDIEDLSKLRKRVSVELDFSR